MDEARALIADGKLDRAIREYEKIIVADPSDLRVKLKIAELYTKRKQTADAIRLYKEVAGSYSGQGFYLKAVTVYKNILRLNPSLIETNEELATLYEKMGLISDAKRQLNILAAALDHKGIAERVVEIRKRIVNLDPKDGDARLKLAELYQRERKLDEAIDQYEIYAKQLEDERSPESKIADVLEKILVHRPGRVELFKKLITILINLGDNKRTLKWLEAGKGIVEKDPDMLCLAAKLYSAQNQNETARTKYMLLAELCRDAGDIDSALDAYCEILVLLPDEEDRLARKIEELRPDALKEVIARASERRALREKEEHEKHAEDERVQLEIEAKSVREAADNAPQKMGKVETLETKSKKVMKPDKHDADASFDLGIVYQKMGLTEEARTEFAKAKIIYEECLKNANEPSISVRLQQIEEAMNPSMKKGDK